MYLRMGFCMGVCVCVCVYVGLYAIETNIQDQIITTKEIQSLFPFGAFCADMKAAFTYARTAGCSTENLLIMGRI